MKIILTVLYVCLQLWLATQPAFAQDTYTLKSKTRETDYTIGSVARQHLTITLPLGYRLDEGSLPVVGQTEAIELRNVQWSFQDKQGKTHYTLDIDWQIFVAAETVKSTPLRGLELVFKRNTQSLTVPVPPDSVLISNLLPPKMDAAHVKPYPDIEPPLINLVPLYYVIAVSVFLLLLTGTYCAWYFGWIRLPRESSMPFRQAWRAIKQLPAAHIDSSKQAMQILSRAFDQYAGFAVTKENVSQVLAQRPALGVHAELIRTFYADLQQTFFAGAQPHHSAATLVDMARQLSKLELS